MLQIPGRKLNIRFGGPFNINGTSIISKRTASRLSITNLCAVVLNNNDTLFNIYDVRTIDTRRTIDSRRNGQPPKSQLAKNTKHSILVILCSGWLFGKLTFLVSWLFGGWPFLLVSINQYNDTKYNETSYNDTHSIVSLGITLHTIKVTQNTLMFW
jgi:hypothetical protein